MARILVADDNQDIHTILSIVLQRDGHTLLESWDGQDALELTQRERPDLVLIDLMMPKVEGVEVCRRLKRNVFTSRIPIIMLTARSGIDDKLLGIEAGADDFVSKPFDPIELAARVRMHLRRTTRELEASPLTGLPGNRATQQALQAWIESGEKFAALYADLDNFKGYNDHYGFIEGDRAIRMAAEVIQEALHRQAGGDGFLGHVGGDDFIGVMPAAFAEVVAQDIVTGFDQGMPALYSAEDRERGFIICEDRRGTTWESPLMTITVAVITNRLRTFQHTGEIAAAAAEIKSYLKRRGQGSKFMLDRRTGEARPHP